MTHEKRVRIILHILWSSVGDGDKAEAIVKHWERELKLNEEEALNAAK